MAKETVLGHKVVGRLFHSVGDLWRRKIDVHIFARDWRSDLLVDVDPIGGIEDKQVAAFATFSSISDAIFATAERAVFDYYQSICREVRAKFGIREANDRRAPILTAIPEVFELIELEGLTIPYARRRPTFGFLCRCTWEDEHGLGIRYEDGELAEIGFQDVAL